MHFGALPEITGPPTSGANSCSAGFIVKIGATTSAVWSLKSAGASAQLLNDVAIGPQGRCYAVGIFRGGSMAIGGQNIEAV